MNLGGDGMTWNLEADRPIYTQLVEQIQLRILTGIYPAGSKLPSVRDMATDASVNPNTMQRALTELEKENLVQANRTSGRFITEDVDMINKIKDRLAKEQISVFLEKMEQLGYEKNESLQMIQNVVREEN